MAAEQRMRTPGRRRRRRRRLKRKIQAWTARILVFSVLILAPVLAVRGALALWRALTGRPEQTFAGARLVGDEGTNGALLVVVDAGHGGKDQGTCEGDILEKDINLAVAKMLAEYLTESGADVILTRREDEKMDLEERAKLANRENADLFISIHCNYYEDSEEIRGLECYYKEDSTEGRELAERIAGKFDGVDEVENRGTKTADYRVLRKTDMPAVLVELGYLSNGEECGKLADKEYQKLLARKIAEAVLE